MKSAPRDTPRKITRQFPAARRFRRGGTDTIKRRDKNCSQRPLLQQPARRCVSDDDKGDVRVRYPMFCMLVVMSAMGCSSSKADPTPVNPRPVDARIKTTAAGLSDHPAAACLERFFDGGQQTPTASSLK